MSKLDFSHLVKLRLFSGYNKMKFTMFWSIKTNCIRKHRMMRGICGVKQCFGTLTAGLESDEAMKSQISGVIF